MTMDDDRFLDPIADILVALPHVEAVTLGGSRAQGTHRTDSDWDLAIYYRGDFRPQSLRDLGWEGTVSELGEWGGGVFNGGAWLRIDGRPVDVHYRDLAVVREQ
ncbi:nucleotidyltransferase domain-containing protein, partial [Phytoactinopolyspora endophytica]|uniref:nucleotidyltransferase domain-containing protein n=1 Tax=Phytoactinopolyspora endophytica TaxID=1642495 RepID=UPI003B8323C2